VDKHASQENFIYYLSFIFPEHEHVHHSENLIFISVSFKLCILITFFIYVCVYTCCPFNFFLSDSPEWKAHYYGCLCLSQVRMT